MTIQSPDLCMDEIRRNGDPCMGIDKTRDVLAKNAKVYVTTTQCIPGRMFIDGIGSEVFDDEGKRYIDLCSRIGSANIGHRDPELEKIFVDFARTHGYRDVVPHHEAAHEEAVACAEALSSLLPGDRKVFFAQSGTEAVEAGLKDCIEYWFSQSDRSILLSTHNAFNGRTAGALSTNTNPKHRRRFPVAYETVHLPFPALHPYFSRMPETRFDFSTTTPETYETEFLAPLEKIAKNIFALLIEDGVQGEGGINVGNIPILLRIFEWCRQRGILLIFDAVQSGIGRTGKMFAFEHHGVVPDALALAKSLADGLPLSAMICRADMDFPPGAHSNTNAGNLLAWKIAREQIRIFRERKILEKVQADTAKIFAPGLAEVAAKFPCIHNVRNLGFMGGIEFYNPASQKPDTSLRNAVVARGLENGLLMLGAGVSTIRWMPPLTISRELLVTAFRVLRKTIQEVCDEHARERAAVALPGQSIAVPSA